MREIAGKLLDWYDGHARDLPWRVGPEASRGGARADPYHVFLSEIMLQQTTVAAVTGYFTRFLTRWPTVEALADAEDAAVMAEWAGLGYYARARNLLKAARVVAGRGGFPETEDGLRALPGVGPYTAAAIAAIAFDRPANVVDGNVERVVSRLFAVEEPLPGAKARLRDLADGLRPGARHGDYAQALMDLGATVCTPRSPTCVLCPVAKPCQARAQGIAAELPRKTPKPAKPVRYGTAWLARRADGAILIERRPDKGLLGGMLALPSSDWSEARPNAAPPLKADWKLAPDPVKHTFTHFHLELTVAAAEVGQAEGDFRHVEPKALPTVMRKALSTGEGILGSVAKPDSQFV